MANKSNDSLGLASILTIIFVIAKIFGLVHFSWLVCFAPFLVPLGVLLILVVIVLIVVGVITYPAR